VWGLTKQTQAENLGSPGWVGTRSEGMAGARKLSDARKPATLAPSPSSGNDRNIAPALAHKTRGSHKNES
jgi:hypothetical protein